MSKGIRIKKGQTGIYLHITTKNLLHNMSEITGLTMSMMVETALREYAYNHRDELKYIDGLMGDQKGNF